MNKRQSTANVSATTTKVSSLSMFEEIDLWINVCQELGYRKQIARQLRTQYLEGIYDNPVTLKDGKWPGREVSPSTDQFNHLISR